MNKTLLAPFAKTTKTKDGGREIWGYATLEKKDKSDEIADFDGTVKAFQKWSDEITKRTDGKSQGNVRLMHQPIAAGKMTHWEPSERTLKDDDGKDKTYKGIYVGVYVPPTKKEVIKDVDEGILNAFSIGGSYQKRWYDSASKAFRYVPELAEFSLVDNPCVEGADITSVINKADGPWNKRDRNLEKEDENLNSKENTESQLKKYAKPSGSFEDLQRRISQACTAKFKGLNNNYWDGYVVATYQDKVIIFDYSQAKYYSVPYTDKDGAITLDDDNMGEVQEVDDFVPVETQKFIQGELKKRADSKVTDSHKTAPKDKPKDKSQYADPDNYKYPIDKDHIKAAVSYFNQDGQKDKGGYSDKQWDSIGKKIATTASKLEGGTYEYKDGKIVTPSNNDKGKGDKTKMAEKSIGEETLKKAAEDAGISLDQIKQFMKAVDNAQGDTVNPVEEESENHGDGTENPTSPIDIKGGQSSVQESEKDTGICKFDMGSLEKAVTDLKTSYETLTKSGKAISDKNKQHLNHAINHIKAAIDGTDYTDTDMQINNETADNGSNSGEESPEVTTKINQGELAKSVIDGLNKSVNSGMNKSFSKIEALFKGIPSQEAIDKLNDKLEKMEQLVKEIHDTPQAGGPILNGGSPAFSKMNIGSTEEDTLRKMINETKDPLVKDRCSQELAIRQAKNIYK